MNRIKRLPVVRHVRWCLAWLDAGLILLAIGLACWEAWFPGDLAKLRDIRTGKDNC